MFAQAFATLLDRFPRLRGLIWHRVYQTLAGAYADGDFIFMNYGFAEAAIPLEEADERNRYPIQLYHHVATGIDVAGLQLLEVGSGRGGGSSYVKRYLQPESVLGIDFSANAVAFANRRFAEPGLRFVEGDAMSLPLAASSYHVVLNVESSHCYASMPRFLDEVHRVLKPGGHLLFADLRPLDRVARLHAAMRESALDLVHHRDITARVVEALDRAHDAKVELIEQTLPRYLHRATREFAACRGSLLYREFCSGEERYLHYIMRKPAGEVS